MHNGYDYYVMQLGLSFHYQNLSKGVVSSADIFYFFSIATLFCIGAIEQIKGSVKYLIVLFAIFKGFAKLPDDPIVIPVIELCPVKLVTVLFDNEEVPPK